MNFSKLAFKYTPAEAFAEIKSMFPDAVIDMNVTSNEFYVTHNGFRLAETGSTDMVDAIYGALEPMCTLLEVNVDISV